MVRLRGNVLEIIVGSSSLVLISAVKSRPHVLFNICYAVDGEKYFCQRREKVSVALCHRLLNVKTFGWGSRDVKS